eukprot:jgi/Tetstr1/432560/TSEL_021931.t1
MVLSISQAYLFSVRKPEKPIDHAVQAEIFLSLWSDTDVHGPEHSMKYMHEGAAADTSTAAQPEAGPSAHNARNAAELPHKSTTPRPP